MASLSLNASECEVEHSYSQPATTPEFRPRVDGQAAKSGGVEDESQYYRPLEPAEREDDERCHPGLSYDAEDSYYRPRNLPVEQDSRHPAAKQQNNPSQRSSNTRVPYIPGYGVMPYDFGR